MPFFKQMALAGIILVILVVGCQSNPDETNEVKTVKVGGVVFIDYAAGYLNGTLFDTSIREVAEKAGIFNLGREYKPAEVIVGEGKIVRGVEESLIGMKEGEAKTVTIQPEKAYGTYRENATIQVSIETFSEQMENLIEGRAILIKTPQGEVPVTIKKIGKDNVTVDFNHPLAGKTVTFAIIVRDIQ